MLKDNKIFDAHIHFNDDYKYNDEMIHPMIKEAIENEVEGFLCASFDIKSSLKAIELSKKYEGIVFAGIAIHPNDVSKTDLLVLETLDELAKNKEVIAIGETGLDYFYTKEDAELQKLFFKKHIEIAKKHNKVLQIHIRDHVNVFEAYDDVIEILKVSNLQKVVIHCFSANAEYAQKFLDLGCYINIGGAVTFKNAKALQEAVLNIPLEKMLIETDAPYLTPHPHRGQLNEAKFINLTVDKIAELKNTKREEVIKITTRNAKLIFNI
ncbi:TatD family hydrolase [Mesoplasma coleopterae]|uniref:Mg-dependent DNase n=1 Tax=Mesoplasma coleopterae TaxID=324078 RepID=A0A2K8P1D6_9MOLU|nr:TatD family hydrolase [Mesoplasma coleopterae]ATZ20574.1 Mg-dependent DNase [Mesoplasma coleopterae]AVN62095.1 hydrolase TatD [Mesoplasma coleopterae]